MATQWFESWFDSPWYPILYSHRDYAEAEGFINTLVAHLNPPKTATFLDLACGRGRHSYYVHQFGYAVTGLDLSAQSIADAQKMEEPGLRFQVHDMRVPYPETFGYILNLFTSFGYFEDKADNLKVLKNVANSLAPKGIFVLDFFNVQKVRQDMVAFSEVERGGILFTVRKRFENGFIVKEIDFVDAGQAHHFEERVQGLALEDFQQLFAAAGIELYQHWGDYSGNHYEGGTSPRLILFGRLTDGKVDGGAS
jgi:SAM-dependent methyltransferase